MASHDGAVTVYSQPGEGTVFHLYFPAHAAEEDVAAADEGPARGNGERLLFVDDEELLVRFGKKALASYGYEVEICTRPAQALAMVQADPRRFALLLTDQTMPGMLGLHLAARVQSIQPGLPVILMTGILPSLMPATAEAAGIRQVLLKPATLYALRAAVHAALSARKP